MTDHEKHVKNDEAAPDCADCAECAAEALEGCFDQIMVDMPGATYRAMTQDGVDGKTVVISHAGRPVLMARFRGNGPEWVTDGQLGRGTGVPEMIERHRAVLTWEAAVLEISGWEMTEYRQAAEVAADQARAWGTHPDGVAR